MSNYHILGSIDDGNRFTVALHISVPDGTNDVGMKYREALVEYWTMNGGLPASRVHINHLGENEQADLDAGALIEVLIEFDTNPGENLVNAKQPRLDAEYAKQVTRWQAIWVNRLRYWGFERDVS